MGREWAPSQRADCVPSLRLWRDTPWLPTVTLVLHAVRGKVISRDIEQGRARYRYSKRRMKQKEGDQRFKGLGSDANAVEHQDKPLIASS